MGSEAQGQVLKSLANKMYQEEVKAYESGKSEDKPKPLKKDMKQTKKEVKEVADKKIDKKLKDVVKNFFQGQKKERASFQVGMDAKKPKLYGKKDCGSGKKRKRKAVI